jgi:hypothetical protein
MLHYMLNSLTNVVYSNLNTTWMAYPMFLQLEIDQSPSKTQFKTKKQQHESGK